MARQDEREMTSRLRQGDGGQRPQDPAITSVPTIDIIARNIRDMVVKGLRPTEMLKEVGIMDEGVASPSDARGHSWMSEVWDVLEATDEIVEEGGDETDLAARLVAERGEAEARRRLALIQVAATRVSLARSDMMQAVASWPGWEQRRCPTCGAVCDTCLASTEANLEDSLDGLA
jgi:hypothetical protein